MITFLLIAVLNGLLIGITRTINGKLSSFIGAFGASFWNHLIGFIFLTFILLFLFRSNIQIDELSTLSIWAYGGGIFGALFVALSSYVFSRIGAMKATIFIIAGQMISAALIDFVYKNIALDIYKILGITLILFGVYLSNKKKSTP